MAVNRGSRRNPVEQDRAGFGAIRLAAFAPLEEADARVTQLTQQAEARERELQRIEAETERARAELDMMREQLSAERATAAALSAEFTQAAARVAASEETQRGILENISRLEDRRAYLQAQLAQMEEQTGESLDTPKDKLKELSVHSLLMRSVLRNTPTELLLHPYPRSGHGVLPQRTGFPVRPRTAKDQETPEEREARACLRRMNEVLARVQELGEALDDPLNVWPRLRDAWERAENEEDPRMAEIVRQAREILPHLRDLEPRIRRVLRRARERISLDRVQEMDRASMRWLVRQPEGFN